MTPQDIIDDVRELVSDTTVDYRHSDAQLLRFVNQSIYRTAMFRPDLFAVFGTVACVQDNVLQSAPTGSLRILEVYDVVGGNAVYESDRATMDMHTPTWRTETAAAAISWMREARTPNKFFIYPKAPANQTLTVSYAKTPTTSYGLTDTITELQDTYKVSLIDCTIFLSQSINDEHVLTGRAKMFFESFVQGLGMDAQSRQVTDTESAGLPPNSGEK